MTLTEAARQALPLLDLTRLEVPDRADAVEALCRRAGTSAGPVAAVCLYPRWIATARRVLAEEGLTEAVRVATVVNFPDGEQAADAVCEAIENALQGGADEIDMVFPWRALREGDRQAGRELVTAARQACGRHPLKVILETGELAEAALIRQAAEIAIEAGADFLKTSTGKVPVNATPRAVEVLLETIRDQAPEVGCKVSGGVRTTEQAREYLDLAVGLMGEDWISPRHFRFGASGLLDDLLATLDEAGAADPDGSNY